MKILVFANDRAWSELTTNNQAVDWIRTENVHEQTTGNDIDAFFNLDEQAPEIDYGATNVPVFINSVNETLQNIKTKENVCRINGWNGFIERNSWEISGNINDKCKSILDKINKKLILVPDEPGFISGRIIAMIINEAYFAKAENVSSKNEIDIAMKLGTNYPYGPFEWARIIGIKNIYSLLNILYKSDQRYRPSSLLEEEALKSS